MDAATFRSVRCASVGLDPLIRSRQLPGLIFNGEASDALAISLATRAGKWIRNQRLMQRAPESMNAARQFIESSVPGARCRSLDSTYNCMGMVFACRRTAIEPEDFSRICREDGYRRLNPTERPIPGDVVAYRIASQSEVEHVAVVVDVAPDIEAAAWKLTVMSQFASHWAVAATASPEPRIRLGNISLSIVHTVGPHDTPNAST